MTEIAETEVKAESRGADFEEFFAAEQSRLVRACLLLTCDVSDAEDLAQEALSRVMERWPDVARMESPTRSLQD